MFQEEAKSVASRACWSLMRHKKKQKECSKKNQERAGMPQDTAKRKCRKAREIVKRVKDTKSVLEVPIENYKSVALRACWGQESSIKSMSDCPRRKLRA